jgi:integrase
MTPRKRAQEGSVRENPVGSGAWQARLPRRLDEHRRPILGSYSTEAECRRALNEAIADLDRGRALLPTGRPGAQIRRLSHVIEEYTEDRAADGLDPISTNTIRDYEELLKNVISHPKTNLAAAAVRLIDAPALDTWIRQMRDAGFSQYRVKKAFALVRAALAWEVRKGRLMANPAREVRRVTTKTGRSRRAVADPVLLPSWRELALLASHPSRAEDRILMLTMAWAGLRWSEAVGLAITDVWSDRPRLSVRRVFTWSAKKQEWVIEEVKGGNADVVPLPTPLWMALRALAGSRVVTDNLGGDLLFRPTRFGHGMKPTITVDHTNWTKRVWYPARRAAGLGGNVNLPELDPRRRAVKIKDLRAYAASVVVDSGGTMYEAAALLRHADVQTTNRYYARAQSEKSQDPLRAAFRANLTLTLEERIDALWTAWVAAYPEHVRGLFA